MKTATNGRRNGTAEARRVITVNIDRDLHKRAKVIAAVEGIDIGDFCEKPIRERVESAEARLRKQGLFK